VWLFECLYINNPTKKHHTHDNMTTSATPHVFVYNFHPRHRPNNTWRVLHDTSAFRFNSTHSGMSVESLAQYASPIMIFHMDDLLVDDQIVGTDDTIQPILNEAMYILEDNDDIASANLFAHFFTVTTAPQLLASRIACTVENRLGGMHLFQQDSISIGGGPFDDVKLTLDQAFPASLTVTRDGERFHINNDDEQDVHVNGQRLPYATRYTTESNVPVVIAGGVREPFRLTLRAFEPPDEILDEILD